MSKFRVLSLDGGGIKGTYTAAVLAQLEAMTGKRLADHFDLITGTSTGGIIAIALGMGVSTKDVLRLYVEKGPHLFPVPRMGVFGRMFAFCRHLALPKCSQSTLRSAIQAVIGEKRLGNSQVRLVIPAFDATSGKIQLFKTAHDERDKQDYKVSALSVALATAAVPTYYPAYAEVGAGCYLDGGVWANRPAMVGLIEATQVLGHPLKDVEILSIGTTSQPFHVDRSRRRGGVVKWNVGLLELLMQAQADAAVGQAKLLTSDRMVRIDIQTKANRFTLDDSMELKT